MDLNTVTVNYWGRGGYLSYNGTPRRSDAGNPLDALYAEEGKYRAYDATQHGIWELQAFYSGEWDKPGIPEPLRPILVGSPATMAVARVEQEALNAGRFDATDDTDAREKGMATVMLRRGQPQFIAALLEAYAGCCAISGCDVTHTLEAAHITPHLGRHTDVVCNGLLLRADLHTLFDLGLLWIDPVSLTVQLHSSLSRSSYADLHGAALRAPAHAHHYPDRQSLRTHIQKVVREVQKGSGKH